MLSPVIGAKCLLLPVSGGQLMLQGSGGDEGVAQLQATGQGVLIDELYSTLADDLSDRQDERTLLRQSIFLPFQRA